MRQVDVFCSYGDHWNLPEFLAEIKEAVAKIPEEYKASAEVEQTSGECYDGELFPGALRISYFKSFNDTRDTG